MIGLGNPGTQYQHTRHNVGFMVMDEWIRSQTSQDWQHKSDFKADVLKLGEVIAIKPLTYMNDSGMAAQAVMSFYDPNWKKNLPTLTNVWAIHDDLDIPLGTYKIQFGTGPKIHNGLLSLYQHLNTDQFWHVRVGVDGRNGQRVMSGADYVLQPFAGDEKNLVTESINKLVVELTQKTL